jgi:GNAT superfamily N-acetyltransferase
MFWTTYPLLNIIQAKLNRNIFKSLIFEKQSIESPTGVDAIVITREVNTHLLQSVKVFIKNYFGSPPTTPVLDIPEDKLLGNDDHIIIVRDIEKNIVGCIRYHYIGIFTTSQNEKMFCVDCFAVHKKWRGKGIGDYLLITLHRYFNKNKIPYCMFLKEGRILPITHTPTYTGIYVFRKLETILSENVSSLTVSQAYRYIDLFREFNPNLFIIRNIASTNQFWKLYRKDTYKVLVCFQDTYQKFEEYGEIKKICWANAWIESPNMTDNVREEASRELSAMMYPEFDYVWMDKEWVGNDSSWKIDGFFHWYCYQWATSINIKRNYCILN